MNETLLTDRRDVVIERLSTGYANGMFEVDELERRLALVHAASSPAELDALVTDLVPAATKALVPMQRVRVMFGSVERRGTWAVPERFRARVVCGNLELDLREARLSGVTTIEVDVTMGNVEIIVPPDVVVDVEASSFMGNIDERTERGTGTSVVHIVGRVKLGNLEVSTLRLGETRRDARRRWRAHRRWRRTQRRAWRQLREWD